MQILVTGATGYLGSAISQQLLKSGHSVHAFVRDRASERAEALQAGGAQIIEGELDADAALVHALRPVEAVVHAAWNVHDPVTTDLRLFDAIASVNQDGSARHLVYTSGCSIYGEHDFDVLTEATPVDPTTPRAQIEQVLRGREIPHTVLRPGMIYGGDSRSSILGRWFEQGTRRSLNVTGDQDKRWSWIHVEDAAAAYRLVTENPKQHEQALYLLAAGASVPTRTLVEKVARLAGQTGGVPNAPSAEESSEYRVFDRNEVIDARLARERLGWKPEHPQIVEDLPKSWSQWEAASH